VNNSKLDPGKTGWGGMDWIGMAQGRDKLRAIINLLVP
jgi:hypothetical protein